MSCPNTESQIMLSLILKSLKSDDIVEVKRIKAVNKLTAFFAVSKVLYNNFNII